MAGEDITNVSRVGSEANLPGNTVFLDIVQFDGPTNYQTGGFALSSSVKSAIGNGKTIVGVVGLNTAGYVLAFDRANDKVKVFYFDYDAAADGAAIEVPNATNLSSALASAEMLIISV